MYFNNLHAPPSAALRGGLEVFAAVEVVVTSVSVTDSSDILAFLDNDIICTMKGGLEVSGAPS